MRDWTLTYGLIIKLKSRYKDKVRQKELLAFLINTKSNSHIPGIYFFCPLWENNHSDQLQYLSLIISLQRIYKALTLHDFFLFHRKLILQHAGVMSTLDKEFTGSWDKWFHTLVIDQLLKSNTQSVVPDFHLTNTWKSSYHYSVMSVFI